MKPHKLLLCALVQVATLCLFSCNTDHMKNQDNPKYLLTPENSDMAMMFSNVEVSHVKRYVGAAAICDIGGLMKYYATFSNMMEYGCRYKVDAPKGYNPWAAFSNEYKMVIAIEDYLENLGDPTQVNNLAITKIMKAAIMQNITDSYGEVPYFGAGLAYINSTYFPEYDTQQVIYSDLLKTLDSALTSISSAATGNWDGKRDLIYGMNMTKWKKFGYSLMLRMAMRISDIDASTAKTYAEKAISGGVIENNSDNFSLSTSPTIDADKNPCSTLFRGVGNGTKDPEQYIKMSDYFVNRLHALADPRSKSIFGGRLKESITAVAAQNMGTYYNDADYNKYWNFECLDSSYPAQGIGTDGSVPSGWDYPKWHHELTSPNFYLWKVDLPIVEMSAAEVWLCRAEMAVNGWNAGVTASIAYENGIKAFASQLNSTGIQNWQKTTDTEMSNYITANPLTGSTADKKQRIAEELWIALYMNPFQAWSYVRRMDLPLPQNVTTATMPLRHWYPDEERAQNMDNLKVAISNMGISIDANKDVETAQRVWWDVH